MNIRKKTQFFFFSDLLRGLGVSLRYMLGGGAARKKSFSGSCEISQKVPLYNSVQCTGCRLCAGICPTPHDLSEVDFRLDADRCVSCGLCVEACPENALVFEGTKDYVRR